MEDGQILDLYFARSEQAIDETSKKYGKYCYTIAYNILYSEEDSKECLNDTWLQAWNSMPPARPNKLSAYLGKITRNLALHVYEKMHRQKRGGDQVEMVYEELEGVLSGGGSPEEAMEAQHLTECINRYLKGLPAQHRMIFVGRYWYMESIQQIAKHLGISQSKTKTTLFRLRNGLKEFLKKEGILV